MTVYTCDIDMETPRKGNTSMTSGSYTRKRSCEKFGTWWLCLRMLTYFVAVCAVPRSPAAPGPEHAYLATREGRSEALLLVVWYINFDVKGRSVRRRLLLRQLESYSKYWKVETSDHDKVAFGRKKIVTYWTKPPNESVAIHLYLVR